MFLDFKRFIKLKKLSKILFSLTKGKGYTKNFFFFNILLVSR